MTDHASRPDARRLPKLGLGWALSLALGVVSLAGQPLPHAVWLSLAPLAFVARTAPVRVAAIGFGLFGLAWWIAAIGWLLPALIAFTHASVAVAVALFVATCSVLALPHALFGALWASMPSSRRNPVVGAALFASCGAIDAGVLPGGFSHGLALSPLVIQVVDVGGVATLHFAIALVSLGAVEAFRPHAVRRRTAVALVMAIPLLLGTYGAIRMKRFEPARLVDEGWTPLSVGYVQPNLGRNDDSETLLAETEALVAEHPEVEIIVWPEVSARYTFTDNTFHREHTAALARRIQRPLVVVSSYVYLTHATPENPDPGYTNTIHVIGPDGVERARYSKHELVAFFEHLPFEGAFPWLRELFPKALRYVPGEGADPLPLTAAARAIPAICYEVLFARHVAAFAEHGGNVIVNPTNDRWFGRSAGSERHLALGLFRAIEQRVPWIRASNSGISAVVSASGELLPASRTRLFERDRRVTTVLVPPRAAGLETSRRIALAVLVLGGLVGLVLARRRGESQSS